MNTHSVRTFYSHTPSNENGKVYIWTKKKKHMYIQLNSEHLSKYTQKQEEWSDWVQQSLKLGLSSIQNLLVFH